MAKELKSFLATTNFYRRFLPHAVEYQSLLTKMIPGNKKNDKSILTWNDDQQEAFQKCKSELAKVTILAYPSTDGQLSLQTDASDTSVGAVLHQLSNKGLQPLGFYSKDLSSAQKKYSTYDHELTGIFQAIKHFQYLLEGRQFTIFTDQKPLVYAFQQKNEKASPRQLRQLDFIAQFSTNIKHITGTGNIVADLFSRIAIVNTENVPVSPNELRNSQINDYELQQYLTNGETTLNLQKVIIPGSKDFLICVVQHNKNRPFVPQELRYRITALLHGMSHPGRKSSIKFIAERYIWPDMKRFIEDFDKNCQQCQLVKINRQNKTPLTHYVPPNGRLEHINVDIIGPLPLSNSFRYCLTIMGQFSKWPEAVPMTDMSAQTVAEKLIDQWISRFGPPLRITTDQGRQFESTIFHELSRTLGIHHLKTTGYHPQSNGLIERFHRTLKTALTANEPEKWTEKLPIVLLALRSTFKEDMQATPAEIVYDQNLRLPGEFFNASDQTTHSEFITKLRDFINQLSPTLTKWHTNEKPFIYKDLASCTHAYVRNDKIKPALVPSYNGPFRIKERHEKYYELIISQTPTKVSLDRLKPAFFTLEDTPPTNANIPRNNEEPTRAQDDETQPNTSRALHDSQHATSQRTRTGRLVKFPARYQ